MKDRWSTVHYTKSRQAIERDIVAAARAWVPQMKEEGAQIIIALSRSVLLPKLDV